MLSRTVCRLRMFGGFHLTSATGDAIKLPTRKISLLLAYFACAVGQAHSREKLAGLFWGETQDDQARGSLRRALAALRATLGSEAFNSDHGAITLLPGHLNADVDHLSQAAAAGMPIETLDFNNLYQGEFLEGYSLDNEAFADWLLNQRTHFRNLAEDVLQRGISAWQSEGRLVDAIRLAQRLVALDPLREVSHRKLIELYLALGDRSRALAHYQQLRGLLAKELGVEPASQTSALVASARVAEGRKVASGPAPADARPRGAPSAGMRTVAVLPFANVSGDQEQEYFADGLSEDIIAALSRVSGLRVIARNSSFSFKGKTVPIEEVGRQLGARYVVEGSIRKSGDRVRITALLVDAENEAPLWAERFDRELTDIFEVQDEVVRHIVAALAIKLTRRVESRLASVPSDDLEAYDCFLHGRELHHSYNREAGRQARAMFERAIELDPQFAHAHASLALVHSMDYANRWGEEQPGTLALLRQHAQEAVRLDADCAHGFWALAAAALLERRHEEALAHAKRAVWLNPNFAEAYSYYGYILHYSGHFEESLAQVDRVVALDPGYPDMLLHIQAQSQFQLHNYETAVAILKRRLIRRPDSDVSRVLLAACYGHLNRPDDARAMWNDALRVNPEYSLEHRRDYLPYRDSAHLEHFFDGLRRAGLAT